MEASAKRRADEVVGARAQLRGEEPRKASSPLDQSDHPEVGDSPFLGQGEAQQRQSLAGAAQRAAPAGRLGAAAAQRPFPASAQRQGEATSKEPRESVVACERRRKQGLERLPRSRAALAAKARASWAASAGRSSFLAGARRVLRQHFAPKGSDKTCTVTTRLARAEALRARAGERAAARALGLRRAARLPAAD